MYRQKFVLATLALTLMVPLSTAEFAQDTQDLDGDFLSANSVELNITSANDGKRALEITKPGSTNSQNIDGSKQSVTVTLGEEGDYSVKLVNSTTDNTIGTPVSFTVDTTAPSNPSLTSPESPTNNGNPQFRIQVTEENSIAESSIDLSFNQTPDGYDGNIESVSVDSGEITASPSEDLKDGTYSFDLSVEDSAGNKLSKSDILKLQVDTVYNGPESAQVTPQGVVPGNQDTVTLNIEPETDDSFEDTQITAGCYKSEETEQLYDSTENFDSNDEDAEFSCEIDLDEYDDQNTVFIDFTDKAGNSLSSFQDPIKTSLTVDQAPPTVENLEIKNKLADGIVNSKPVISFDAEDNVSDISKVVYYYEDAKLDNRKELDYPSENYTINPPEETGQNTLFVAAKDDLKNKDGESVWGFGPAAEAEFNYTPSAEPSFSLTVPENLSVTSGSSTSLEIGLENNGLVPTDQSELVVSGPSISETRQVDSVNPSETRSITFELESVGLSPGVYSFNASVSNTTKKFELSVEANATQKSSIESEATEFLSSLEAARSTFRSIKSDLSDEQRNKYKTRLQELNLSAETVDKALEQGNYAVVSETLSNSSEAVQQINSDLAEDQDTIKSQKLRRNALIAGAVLLLLLVTGSLIFFASDKLSFNYRRIVDSDISIDKPKDVINRIRSIFEEEDESEEFAWEGFED